MTGRTNLRRNSALAILLLAYILNYIDRQIIGVLAIPIKDDLQLSDTQLGLVGGVAFALFYSVLGVPVAWLADRWSRVKIITIAVAVWSLFTALCGLSQTFWQMFLSRVGVGVGEAGGAAPSYSLIADIFPPAQRTRALALLALGLPIGSAIGVIGGGLIGAEIDWRMTFLVVGLLGLPVAALVHFGVRPPERMRAEASAGAREALSFGVIIATLRTKPSFWLMSLGAAISSIPLYGLMFWLPSYFRRSLGFDLVGVAWFYGSIVLVGGVLGVCIGGWIGDHIGRDRPRLFVLIPAAAVALAAPTYAAAIFAPASTFGWLMFIVPQALAYFYLGPVLTSVQQFVPSEMRATASSIFFLIINLIGGGLGAFLMGAMADLLNSRFGSDALRYSILFSLVFYLIAGLLMAIAAGRVARDWEPDTEAWVGGQ